MKKIMKSKIFLIVILCIISCSIGVYAATTYKASDVVYNASDGTSMNVNDALNDIYQIKTLGDATESDIISGKKAVVQGKLITGTLNKFNNVLETISNSSTYATSVTGNLVVPNNITEGILIATFVGVNATFSNSSIKLSNGGTATQIFKGSRDSNGTNEIVYKIDCTPNEKITHTFSHSTTGGGISVIRLLFLY